MTFSIVVYRPNDDSGGVAVATRSLAVGALVPAAESGAGALATQACTNVSYRPTGLSLLRAGRRASDVVAALLAGDEGCEARQVGVVDRTGSAATWTGRECMPFAGDRTGDCYAIQGNLLTGPEVLDAIEGAWLTGDGSMTLAERLLAALAAGDAAGGDLRGRQSAALYVVSADGGLGHGTDVEVDLRVDDAPRPISELTRLLSLADDLGGEQ